MARIYGRSTVSTAMVGGTMVVQVLATLLATILFYLLTGPSAALGACFGGTVALANSLYLAWRIRQGERKPQLDAQQSMRLLYRSSLERFFVVGLLLAAGFWYLGLASLPMLAGFVLGQMTLIVFQFLCAMKFSHNG